MRTSLHAAVVALTLIAPAIAQDASDETLVREAKVAIVRSLARPADQVAFESVGVSRGNGRTLVCGIANGKRFVAGTGEKAGEPNIEGKLSASVFNYMWNLRCAGMKTEDAASTFGRELREDACTVDSWNWVRWGTRSMQIQGLASCQSGRILIKVFEKDDYLGSGTGRIEARAFTVYIDRRPSGDSIRIESATGK